MVIVETPTQFDAFIERAEKYDWILIPILADTKLHELENSICALYVKLLDDNKDYLISFNHIESLNLSMDYIPKLDLPNVKKYVYDKKLMTHMYPFRQMIDVNILHYMRTNSPLDIDHITTSAHQFFHVKYYKLKNMNRIIPLTKHLEYCRLLASELERFIDLEYYNEMYNGLVLENLVNLEKPGLYTDDGLLYSHYNIFTATGRASNRFGGVNFSAMNKSDETRNKYKTRFDDSGYLVDFDYSANHLMIIADLIGYEFPDGQSPHEYLGKMYFDTDELTPEQYSESKTISFRLLYGGIDSVFEKIDFFREVNTYIRKLWSVYKKHKYIESPISKKKMYAQNLGKMNSQKLFNYLLQLVEFEEMQVVFNELNIYLKDKKTEFILYLYDSMLFDFHVDDGTEVLFEIKRILEFGNKSVSAKLGKDYGHMKNVDNYFIQ